MTVDKTRNLFLAPFLTLLVPGLGQLYNGDLKKAVLFYLAQFVVFIPPFIIGLQYSPDGLFAILGMVAVFYLIAMGEATWRSLVIKKITLKPYNKWYVYCLIILSANLVAGSFNSTFKQSLIGIKPFYLPSGSNEPTLMTGDHVMVDLRKKTPVKGTFMVFTFPGNPKKDYLKRVIATEGDLLEIKNKRVFVNHKKLNEPYVVHQDSKILPKNASTRDNLGPVRIPAGKVFVMGDNRDRSYDSRFFGPVDQPALIGTVLYIYWAKDKGRIGVQFN